MTKLTNQEIFMCGVKSGKFYQCALERAEIYSRQEKNPDKDYDALFLITGDLKISIKWAEEAGCVNQQAIDELAKWLPIFEPIEKAHEASLTDL